MTHTKKLTEEQQEFWKQLTTDVGVYQHEKVSNDIMMGLMENPHLLKDPNNYHRIQCGIEEHFKVLKVSLYRDPSTYSYMVAVYFHDGYTQQMRIGDEHLQRLHSSSDRKRSSIFTNTR